MNRIGIWRIGIGIGCFAVVYVLLFSNLFQTRYSRADYSSASTTPKETVAQAAPAAPVFDKVAYDRKLFLNANVGTSTSSTTPRLWPAKTPYPQTGALLPYHRIIAYYGNFYAKGMGVLGEYPKDVMKQKLFGEVAKWNAADPSTPAIPAIDYIVVTAQGSAGADGMYRARMPADQVQKAIDLAGEVHGIVILDVQVGKSNLRSELPLLAPYLKNPIVHLAIDPEFSMKTGAKPGTVIGTFSSADVNYAVQFLADIVRQDSLPPKILVVHRFTGPMVTGAQNIQPLPEVQVVMDMDGWGSPAKKLGTYSRFIHAEPVQFTGFKLFYKNDLKPPSTRILAPAELLKLSPQPLFIQFQ